MPARTRAFPSALEPIHTGLPAGIAASIGNAIARHSYLDWVLGQVLYSLMEISVKQGRVVVRPPRPADYVRAVKDLYAFHKLETRFDFPVLTRRLELADAARNILARSIYMRDTSGGSRRIRLARGPWASSHEVEGRAMPRDGLALDRALLTRMRKDIEDGIARAEKLLATTNKLLRVLHEIRRTRPGFNRRSR